MIKSSLIVFSSLLTLAGMSSAIEIIAHRGYSGKAPENTVAAFKLAWENKADACELDVHLSMDNEMVLIHDYDARKTAGKPLLIEETNAADLLQLDVGSWKGPEWAGEKLPTLSQALETLPVGHQRFFIEIKCGVEIIPFLQITLETMRNREKQLVVMAFERRVAADTKKAMPWLQVYRLASPKDKLGNPRKIEDIIQQSKDDKLDGISLGRDWAWTEEMVKKVRDAELQLYVWTVNKPEEAVKMQALGVDGIITDEPVLIRQNLTAAP